METQNNTFNEFELDDLRQQIEDLKNKVNKQGRLNEELVKKAIQGKMRGVHGIILKLAIVAIDVSHMGDDLVGTANKLVKMKRNRVIGQRIGIGVALLWLAWFCYEYFMLNSVYGTEAAWFSMIGILVGALIGGLIGIRIFNKMQRANDEMIDQINEFTHEQ